jgi:hypothetical protein
VSKLGTTLGNPEELYNDTIGPTATKEPTIMLDTHAIALGCISVFMVGCVYSIFVYIINTPYCNSDYMGAGMTYGHMWSLASIFGASGAVLYFKMPFWVSLIFFIVLYIAGMIPVRITDMIMDKKFRK